MITLPIETFDTCGQAAQAAAEHLAATLEEHAHEKSLLLLSGGSSADVAARVASNLDINTTNSVTLAQVDERYTQPGHESSNWQLLQDRGLDTALFGSSVPILEHGTTADNMAESYNELLTTLLDEHQFSIALLGMGADGHIAGMLPTPQEEFKRFLNNELVVDFKGPDFERITTTRTALARLDEIIVYACGPEKANALNRLSEAPPTHEHPAQMLKDFEAVKIYYGENKEG